MQEDIVLSVIVPIYNNEKYLKCCIESIINQTYKQLEVILVDDGSTDGSREICQEYAKKNKNIRVIYKENEGACYARRDGVLVAQGEYVGFIDSDDWIEPNMYHSLMAEIIDNGADIVTSGFIIGVDKEDVIDTLPEGIYENNYLKKLCEKMIFDEVANTGGILVSVCNKVYKRELILPYLKDLKKEIRLWEDIGYVYPPFVDANKVVITHKCYYHYRQNTESTSHRFDRDELKKTLYSLQVAEANFLEYSDKIQLGFQRKYAQIMYRYLWRCCIDKEKRYGSKRQIIVKMQEALANTRFKEIISNVLAAGDIKEYTEEIFLKLLLEEKVEKAYIYCKKESLMLPIKEFIYWKIFRKLFSTEIINFIKKRILKYADK